MINQKYKSDLQEKFDKYADLAYQHKKNEKVYAWIYRILGYGAVLLSTISSCIIGSSGLSTDNPRSSITFSFTLLTSILTTTLVFFKIQDLKVAHHSTSSQYSDLCNDMQVFLLNGHDPDECKEMVNLVSEKIKFIKSYSPNLSNCI